MARAKSERARSKTLAIDDLTQHIEQLQAFIPKLEDLGREGFPYLEGALARTELQLRECIKRAFGEKSSEFQSHRQLKLALSSPAEKKQTLTLLRGLIASLEDKKLELQGIKPPPPQEPASQSNAPQLALVPPAVSTANLSVTSVTSSSSGATGSTLHLVPSVEQAAVPTPTAAAAPAPIVTPSPGPPALEPVLPKAAPSTAQSIPPRTPIEPISSLFRTQETKPLPPRSEQTLSASATPAPSAAATTSASMPPAAVAVADSVPIAAPAALVETPSHTHGAPPPVTAPLSASTASISGAQTAATPAAAFSTTQEVPVAPPQSVALPTVASPPPPAMASAPDTDHLSLTKTICQRFHAVARQLRLRGEYRSTLNVEDELDVQDLLHALLRQHFDDIGSDEWTPPYSSGAPRTTFLLDHDRLAVVVKKTRTGLSRKDLTDQVRSDAERYRARGRCTHLLCFIYDPEGRVGNPRGLESELTSRSELFIVDVVVAPK